MAGEHTDVLESLTPTVRKRVEVLRTIQSEHDELEAKFFEERAALEAKYQKLYEPLYSKAGMSSTSTAEPSSAMEEARNWLDMPDEIMGLMILHRLGAVEILINAQKVCTTWRKICKDPAMWKVIDFHDSVDSLGHIFDYDMKKLMEQAVDRSCGELIDISINSGYNANDLLDYVSQCSSKLKCLRLGRRDHLTSYGLLNTLKWAPHLETLEISDLYIYRNELEEIGRNCPQLKSLTMNSEIAQFYVEIDTIANSMPALRHLKMIQDTVVDDDEIRALLNGCPHLESLHLIGCRFHQVDKNLQKLCRERIKDVKFDDYP